MQRERAEYLSLRRKFEPTSVKLVIVAESPPVSGKYFYDPQGSLSEPLLKALTAQAGASPKTKEESLLALQRRGWILVDATYEAVDKHQGRRRDDVIAHNYPHLCEDLKRLLGERWPEVPLILLKANVCDLLEPKLTSDGFNVLNKGQRIYFPSHGNQNHFARQFAEVIKTANL